MLDYKKVSYNRNLENACSAATMENDEFLWLLGSKVPGNEHAENLTLVALNNLHKVSVV